MCVVLLRVCAPAWVHGQELLMLVPSWLGWPGLMLILSRR